jgi:hypothetical protein
MDKLALNHVSASDRHLLNSSRKFKEFWQVNAASTRLEANGSCEKGADGTMRFSSKTQMLFMAGYLYLSLILSNL